MGFDQFASGTRAAGPGRELDEAPGTARRWRHQPDSQGAWAETRGDLLLAQGNRDESSSRLSGKRWTIRAGQGASRGLIQLKIDSTGPGVNGGNFMTQAAVRFILLVILASGLSGCKTVGGWFSRDG